MRTKVGSAILLFSACVFSTQAFALSNATPKFKKAFVIVLENTDEDTALSQPFMGMLAKEGVYFSNFWAVTHPSQPNYIALTSGSTHGVSSNENVDLKVRHIGDLLEAKGLKWKAYAEGFPGECFLGKSRGKYARKHLPMISYVNIQKNPERCANIVEAGVLRDDIERGTLPELSLFIPNNDNNGHDTSPEYADRYLQRMFGPLLKDPRFIKDMLFIVTFDESANLAPGKNQIFTAFYGNMLKPGVVKTKTGLYDLLRTFEDNWGLGTLGLEDDTATAITGMWK